MSGAPIDIRPLAIADLWSFLEAKKFPLAPSAYGDLAREVASGRAVGAFIDGRPIAFGAVSRVDGVRSGIAWLSVADGGVGKMAIGIVRAIRSYLAIAAAEHAEVVALVAVDNRNGERLARAVGLVPTERMRLSFRIWQRPPSRGR